MFGSYAYFAQNRPVSYNKIKFVCDYNTFRERMLHASIPISYELSQVCLKLTCLHCTVVKVFTSWQIRFDQKIFKIRSKKDFVTYNRPYPAWAQPVSTQGQAVRLGVTVGVRWLINVTVPSQNPGSHLLGANPIQSPNMGCQTHASSENFRIGTQYCF